MTKPISPEDSHFILERTQSVFKQLRGEQILLTGATGFFGKWLMQGLLAAEDHFKTGNTFTIVTRNTAKAIEGSPWLASRANIEWIESDVRQLQSNKKFSTIIHAAVAASASLNDNLPTIMFDTIVEGTRQVLKIARENSCQRFLFVSSGAVYGDLPNNASGVSEDFSGAPNPLLPPSAYGEAKRAAEFLCATEARYAGLDLKIARCFAFVGPYLPLDTHFAIGNFLLNVLRNEPIKINGDGTAMRSYLYAADLVVWLLKILVDGKSGQAYNVGSERAFSIAELANEVSLAGGQKTPVQISKAPLPGQKRNVYFPSTLKAKTELGLSEDISLASALAKTLQWHRQEPQSWK